MCVRIAVFSVTVFYDERVVIVAEQRPDASEEDSFQWMSRVLQVNTEQCTKNKKNTNVSKVQAFSVNTITLSG